MFFATNQNSAIGWLETGIFLQKSRRNRPEWLKPLTIFHILWVDCQENEPKKEDHE